MSEEQKAAATPASVIAIKRAPEQWIELRRRAGRVVPAWQQAAVFAHFRWERELTQLTSADFEQALDVVANIKIGG